MPNAIYANARASALTATLLGVERLNRMIDSASVEETVKILSEVNFGEGLAVSSSEAERLIEAEEARFSAFVKDAAPSDKLMRFLLAGYDFHNAEAILRCKYLKADFTPMIGAEGMYPVSFLEEKIFTDSYKRFNRELATAIADCDELFVSGKANGQNVSAVFRRALYTFLWREAGKDRDLRTIVRAKADAANIAVAFRSRNFAQASEMLVKSGSLSEEDIRFLTEEPPESIREKYRFHLRKEWIEAALEGAAEEKPLTEFEKISDSFALQYLKKERYNSEGHKPFLRYCYYKISEIENVKIILSCLRNNVEKNLIRMRIRESYEGQNGYYR